MEPNIFSALGIFGIEGSNKSVYGRNIEAGAPRYWLLGSFRSRKVDPAPPPRPGSLGFLEVLQKQAAKRIVVGGSNDG